MNVHDYEAAQLIKSLDKKNRCRLSVSMSLLLNGVAQGITPQKLMELADQKF